MGKTAKWVGLWSVGLLLTGILQGAEPQFASAPAAAPATRLIPPAVLETLDRATATGEPFVEMDMLLKQPDQIGQLRRALAAGGGVVLREEQGYVQARLPVAAAHEIAQSLTLAAVGINERLTVEADALDQPLAAEGIDRLAVISTDAMQVSAFRNDSGAQGSGVRVAVIDSGVDPGHPDLQQTVTGTRKLVDWKDFSGEGLVETPLSLSWSGGYAEVGGVRYRLPDAPVVSQGARFGFWEESRVPGRINRDLDRNGSQIDRFGVLLVDSAVVGQYDTVYVDTNNNDDFTDEEPLQLFRKSGDVGRLGGVRSGPLGEQRLNFVVSDLDTAGLWVNFGFDGNGHGTQMAGIIGAANAAGLTGVAPGAEIMAIKVISAAGEAGWFAIASGIKYAAANGASIINISIGGIPAAARFDSTASELLNRISREYGVLILLAADNTGPGLSSGTTMGNPSDVLTIGAYHSPAMWKRDRGWVVPEEGIWSQSGMGPRPDGTAVPNLVAPGGGPTTSPRWLHTTGYTTTLGTSVATAYASGAAALLMSAGRLHDLQASSPRVKRAMEMGARKIANFGSYEQGNGLILLSGAYDRLQQINSLLTLKVGTNEGQGGLLARSYLPGMAEFWLTNLDPDLTRVNIVSSEPWVKTPYQSLTLPPNRPRRLPLEIDPPESPGLYSAFVTVHQPQAFGSSTTIPVTYVRPLLFQPDTDYTYRATDYLQVARYRRYFLQVDDGATQLEVTVNALPGLQGLAQGTVQVYIFRPDGKAVYRSLEIGALGEGLTALFQTEAPVAGVWEVVVTAIPSSEDTNLNASYTLMAREGPRMIDPPMLKISQVDGSKVTHLLQFSNALESFTGRVEAVGLTKVDTSQPWRVMQRLHLIEDFTLKEFVSQMRIEIDNPIPLESDLDLLLYRYEPYGLVSQSVVRGSSHETIELSNVPDGRYQVFVVAHGSVLPQQYQYRRLVAVEGYHLAVNDPIRHHIRGESWTTGITIVAPDQPGRYAGYLLLKDTEKNQALMWIPFQVSIGQPELSVEPLAPHLTQGVRSPVVLEVREALTGKLVDTPLFVNGQRFESRDGHVTVPIMPDASIHLLQVQIDNRDYQFVHKEIRLPVSERWELHPTGAPDREENLMWRRKVWSQWP